MLARMKLRSRTKERDLYNDVQPIVRRIEEKLLAALNGKRVDEFLSHLGLIVIERTAQWSGRPERPIRVG